jgi:TRAP-type C4-dicarboxylate transport system permease small subunit
VEVAIVVLFAVLTTAVFAQVVARYAFNQPPAWTEELARFCQVWIILLASSICLRKGSHLAVDYLAPVLGPRTRRVVSLFNASLITVYAGVVMVWGVRLMMIGVAQTSPALQVSMGLVYLIFPVAGGLMVLESLVAVFYRERKPGSS